MSYPSINTQERAFGFFRRPIRKLKHKHLKPFLGIFSDYQVYFSADCDSELRKYVLKYFNNNFFSNLYDVSYAWIHLRSYGPLNFKTSKEPVAIIFTSFKYLSRWLDIANLKYVHSMEYCTTSMPYHTSFQVLGTIQFVAEDDSQP